MRIQSLTLLCLVAACSPAAPPSAPKIADARAPASTLHCKNHGGFESKVCPTSMLALVANPDSYNGRVIAIQGFVINIQGTHLVFPNAQFAKDRDLASAVVCSSSATLSCAALDGHIGTLFGQFSAGYVDSNFFSPIGSINLMHVRGVKPVGPASPGQR